jgi:hypothetical protein
VHDLRSPLFFRTQAASIVHAPMERRPCMHTSTSKEVKCDFPKFCLIQRSFNKLKLIPRGQYRVAKTTTWHALPE